jgi:putative hydrolase of the HAD superfamily
MIRAVIFDVGGVLVDYDLQTDQQYVQKALGLDDATITAIWEDLVLMMGRDNKSEHEFWQHITAAYAVPNSNKTKGLLYRSYAQAMQLRPAILAYAAALRTKGLRTAIVSNTIAPHAAALSSTGVFGGFDPIVLSHEVGLRKPDEDIYRYALDLLGIMPNEAIFIDDTPEWAEGARRIGIPTVIAKGTAQIIQSIDEILQQNKL